MKRITARVRHGRRQQHINLPPSGLRDIGHGRAEDSSTLLITMMGQKQAESRSKCENTGRDKNVIAAEIQRRVCGHER